MRAPFAWALVALFLAFGAECATPKRVLIIHSFGRDFAPYDAIMSVFRTELAERFKEPITFVEANLDFRRAVHDKEEAVFREYLRSRFEDAPPDVVIAIGAPAARFHLRHRGELFPDAPFIAGALEERVMNTMKHSGNVGFVAASVDLPGLVANILQVLPETETIAVVIGASELERFWRGELQRELAPYAGRVKFEWLNDLSLVQMQDRVAKLPPHSAVLYALLIVDAAGVPHERQDGLARLHAVANAPIFGLYGNELGKGVVGGPYSSERIRGELLAAATLRALGGLSPSVDIAGMERPVYDWRELQRWNIDPARLPAGSEVRFKPPSIWDEHRMAIVATAGVLLFQGLLIAALLGQRFRRQHAEREARHLGGRILTAQEEERRRLAREMHDDVSQRLAALAIVAMEAKGGVSSENLDTIRERLLELSEDVHALSYRLHPSVIDDLGLVAALKVECNRVACHEPLQVNFASTSVPPDVASSAALCLFRVAQEALRNVVRHAEASTVDVSLEGKEGGIVLAVRDDGRGFDDSRDNVRASLGLVSMQERVRLVGGKLDIVSRPDQGTSIVAWVPLQEAA